MELFGEMKKLAEGLEKRNIDFEVRELWGGSQIWCDEWDAVCHDMSYGHEEGLIEVMGLGCDDGDVIGYLTADDVLELLDEQEE